MALKDGTRLVMLSDARAVFLDRFANITHSMPLAHAGELMLKAAKMGKRAPI